METPHSGFEVPSQCPRCGYLTGILSKIPLKNPPAVDLFRSHYSLSLAERTSIQAEISSSEASIEALEAEILKLQAATKLIQSRLSNIQEYADYNRALISPWHSLPDELLVEIFTDVCEDSIKVLERTGDIWTLQQVCVRWRSLVQSTPLLWSDITIGDNDEEKRGSMPSIVATRIQMCLELSKAVPLSITSRIPASSVKDTVLCDAIKAILGHSHRWEEVELNRHSLKIIHETDTLDTVIKKDGLSCLQSLIIHGCSRRYGLDIFKGANALKDILLISGPFPSTSEFPWTNLTNLTVNSCTVGGTSIYDIGSLFHSLTKLEDLEWYWNEENLQPPSSVVTMPALQRIYIEYSLQMAMVLPMLRVPRLTELGLINASTITDLDTSPIVSMLRTSECGVKTLDVPARVLSSSAILQVLREARDVEVLIMLISSEMLRADEILPKLTWCSCPPAGCHCEGSHILPSLRELKVEPFKRDHWELVDGFLVRMKKIMRSRSGSGVTDTTHSEGVPVALALVESELYVPAEIIAEYRILIKDVETLGEELGIQVKFQLVPE